MCVACCIACSTCSASPIHDCLICLSSPSFVPSLSLHLHNQVCRCATAMKASAAAIKTFVQTSQDVCPCSDIPCTRSGHCPKWLLASSRHKKGQIWRQDGCHVIKSSCLSHENVQNLIIAGDTLPLPAVLGEVVDSLETWGANCWTCWLQKSLKLMHEHLKEDNMHGGVAPCKMRVFHDCIFLHAEREARNCFMRNTANCNHLLTTWNACHWVKCWEQPFFWDLAYGSMHFVQGVHASTVRAVAGDPDSQTPATAETHAAPQSPTSN